MIEYEVRKGTLLSVDPGLRGCGCAVWLEGRLVCATYVESPERTLDGPRAHARMARAVADWAHQQLSKSDPMWATFKGDTFFCEKAFWISSLVVEFPQTYGGRASRGDANDLLPLAAVDGALAALLHDAAVAHYFPHEWKGSIEKPKRASDPYPIKERVEGRLDPCEAACAHWPENRKHGWDVADGIGVGLKALGRFERKRVFARE